MGEGNLISYHCSHELNHRSSQVISFPATAGRITQASVRLYHLKRSYIYIYIGDCKVSTANGKDIEYHGHDLSHSLHKHSNACGRPCLVVKVHL